MSPRMASASIASEAAAFALPASCINSFIIWGSPPILHRILAALANNCNG